MLDSYISTGVGGGRQILPGIWGEKNQNILTAKIKNLQILLLFEKQR
jgi:hypothetical protein